MYTSSSFQKDMSHAETYETAEKLIEALKDNAVLRNATISVEEAFKLFNIQAFVNADGRNQMAVMLAFHAADMEWLDVLEDVGARKHVCRSIIRAD